MKQQNNVNFSIGQIIHHRIFDYRGVIVDVDPFFSGTDEWYDTVALSKPPKDKPWYHVLVDGGAHQTYVAERNLEPDQSGMPVNHPHLLEFFTGLHNGVYATKDVFN